MFDLKIKLLMASFVCLFIISCNTNVNNKENITSVDAMRIEALNGNIQKQTKLGIKYRDGNGVTKDINEAIKWFDMAASKGDATAIMSLGVIYGGGNLGVPKDNIKAIDYYKLVATSNTLYQPMAQLFLAKNYDELGDKKNALVWYKKVIENKSSLDMNKKFAQEAMNKLINNK